MAKETHGLQFAAKAARPYVMRALRDPEFRRSLGDALGAARGVVGELKGGGARNAAAAGGGGADALSSLVAAFGAITGEPKPARKKRGIPRWAAVMLAAGFVLGILFNPFNGVLVGRRRASH